MKIEGGGDGGIYKNGSRIRDKLAAFLQQKESNIRLLAFFQFLERGYVVSVGRLSTDPLVSDFHCSDNNALANVRDVTLAFCVNFMKREGWMGHGSFVTGLCGF